jgi:serine protease Do
MTRTRYESIHSGDTDFAEKAKGDKRMKIPASISHPVAAAAIALGIGSAIFFGTQTPTTQAQDHIEGVQTLRSMSDAFVHIADTASPAVAFIEVESKVSARNTGMPEFGEGDPLAPFFRFFDRPGQPGQQNRPLPPQLRHGQGTGFIISPDGYMLTNGHVVDGAERISVTLGDGREFEAKLIGVDKPTDIAVIKVEDGELPYLPLGDSDALNVGEIVMAIGNPFGQRNSITQGIVSAKGRNGVGITDYADFIQTDAAINPGNSGGPLLNLDGEVVGMNTAILSRTGGNLGIGFAIPVNTIREIKDTLISGKSVERGYLGVNIQNVDAEIAEYFNTKPNQGAIIADILEDSPAEKSGLQRDDIVVEYDGKAVRDAASLRLMVAGTTPGDTVNASILRDGKETTIPVTVGKRDEEQIAAMRGEGAEAPSGLGMSLQNLTPDLAQQLGFEAEHGIVITEVEPGSSAARAGLRPGMVVLEVNRQPVESVAQFKTIVTESDKDSVLLRVTDNDGPRYAILHKE